MSYVEYKTVFLSYILSDSAMQKGVNLKGW